MKDAGRQRLETGVLLNERRDRPGADERAGPRTTTAYPRLVARARTAWGR